MRSALESPIVTKSDFKDDDSKMKSSRFERVIKKSFENTVTKDMFDDYFQVVQKHQSIHKNYNQIKEMKILKELKDKEAKLRAALREKK